MAARPEEIGHGARIDDGHGLPAVEVLQLEAQAGGSRVPAHRADDDPGELNALACVVPRNDLARSQ